METKEIRTIVLPNHVWDLVWAIRDASSRDLIQVYTRVLEHNIKVNKLD